MGFTAKANSSKESWGMGLLLVFFPADNSTIVDKSMLFSSSPPPSSPSFSSSAKFSSITTTIRRTNSNRLLTKAQSTISICALLVFVTLLFFTLSTFEPTARAHPIAINGSGSSSRRFLAQNPTEIKPRFSNSSWLAKMWKQKQNPNPKISRPPAALQGLGTLYRRGTRAMTDLVVGHVAGDATHHEFRLFLRLLHRSGITARADTVFVFDSSTASNFDSIIREENESFLQLLRLHNETTGTRPGYFDPTRFIKPEKKETGESIWGKRARTNYNNSNGETESTQLSYGSVVSFDASELDPENSLSGFLEHIPMGLRRWACYPMLLGRVRRNFKHIMLVDVKNSVLIGDPLGPVRNRSPESVRVYTKSEVSKHSRKNSDKTQSHLVVNSAVITGGARGIRRLSNAVLTEIVRASSQHKRKSTVTESGILSQLVGNEFFTKSINLIKSVDLVAEPSSLNSAAASLFSGYSVVQRGNSNSHEVSSIIMRLICSSDVDSSVYRDC
ncbi:hypothetical protein UlMin_042963 [Ulmus minor]